MPRVFVPEQYIRLELTSDHDRWMGSMRIGDQEFRVEAYAVGAKSETTRQLIDELHVLAECGDALNRIMIGTRICYLVVMPAGA